MSDTCKGCGAEIIWKKTPKGKPVPLDPPEKRYVQTDQFPIVAMVDTWKPHHATCPKAKDFRTLRT